MGVDPRFERAVLAELALSERRVCRHDPFWGARALARTLHRGRHDLLAHLIARVVARAAIEDLLEGARPDGDSLAALALLPDPRLTA